MSGCTSTDVDIKPQGWPATGLRWFINILLKCYCPLTVRGGNNLPEKGPFIICSNHCSHMDAAIIIKSTQHLAIPTALVAAKDYFFSSSKTFIRRCLHLIPVDREARLSSTRDTLNMCQQFAAQERGIIIIYPEGTRSVTGDMQAFKKGAVYIALKLGLPIVPAHIKGSHKAFAKGKRFVRPGRCQITFGHVLSQDQSVDHEGKTIRKNAENLTALLYERIRLLGESHD
jgi:1-acyl-sn-glycerol-3-phosphate acyltransferase